MGFAVGSNTNLILATEEIMKAANRDVNRLVIRCMKPEAG